jgi:hypothetical protein
MNVTPFSFERAGGAGLVAAAVSAGLCFRGVYALDKRQALTSARTKSTN